ncbi:unnamed protein product [Ectocarpus sp. 6 AP-2014]
MVARQEPGKSTALQWTFATAVFQFGARHWTRTRMLAPRLHRLATRPSVQHWNNLLIEINDNSKSAVAMTILLMLVFFFDCRVSQGGAVDRLLLPLCDVYVFSPMCNWHV